MTPRSASAAPRRGASPRTVTSSEASTIARSASIMSGERGGRRRGSGRLPCRRLLHETQPVLHVLFLPVHVQQSQVLLDGGTDARLERVALDTQILDHPLDLSRLARRLVQELAPLELRLLDHQLALPARLLLDVLGQLLGGEEGLLQDPLALLVIGETRLDLGQLLLERVVLDHQALELARDQIEERADLLRIEAPHSLREAVAVDVDRRNLHSRLLSPNRARPTRTSVAPSSTATSKSSVIPIDSCRSPSDGCRLRACSSSCRRRRQCGRLLSGSGS